METNLKEANPESERLNQPQTKEEKMITEFKKKYIEKRNPFQHAGIFSRMFYGWVNPLLKVSLIDLISLLKYNKPLKRLRCCYKGLI